MQQSKTRTWFLRGVFIFMAFTLFGGYVLAVVAGTPVFQQFTGVGGAYSGPDREIENALSDLRDDPSDMAALQRVGIGYLTLATQPSGEVETIDGIRTYPEFTDAERDRFLARSSRAFRLYLEENPGDKDTTLNLARVYEAQQNHVQALQVYRELTAASPEDRDLFWAMGLSAYFAEDVEEAQRAMTRFLELAPNDARASDAEQIIEIAQATANQPILTQP